MKTNFILKAMFIAITNVYLKKNEKKIRHALRSNFGIEKGILRLILFFDEQKIIMVAENTKIEVKIDFDEITEKIEGEIEREFFKKLKEIIIDIQKMETIDIIFD